MISLTCVTQREIVKEQPRPKGNETGELVYIVQFTWVVKEKRVDGKRKCAWGIGGGKRTIWWQGCVGTKYI